MSELGQTNGDTRRAGSNRPLGFIVRAVETDRHGEGADNSQGWEMTSYFRVLGR